jgi:hypothetical protein
LLPPSLGSSLFRHKSVRNRDATIDQRWRSSYERSLFLLSWARIRDVFEPLHLKVAFCEPFLRPRRRLSYLSARPEADRRERFGRNPHGSSSTVMPTPTGRNSDVTQRLNDLPVTGLNVFDQSAIGADTISIRAH